jgi:hypothetical protein
VAYLRTFGLPAADLEEVFLEVCAQLPMVVRAVAFAGLVVECEREGLVALLAGQYRELMNNRAGEPEVGLRNLPRPTGLPPSRSRPPTSARLHSPPPPPSPLPFLPPSLRLTLPPSLASCLCPLLHSPPHILPLVYSTQEILLSLMALVRRTPLGEKKGLDATGVRGVRTPPGTCCEVHAPPPHQSRT